MTDMPAPKPKRPSNNPKGRPSGYSAEYAAEICQRIANGQSILSFRTDETMPDPDTFYRWQDQYPEFAEAVGRAREKSAAALIDQAVSIADDASNDTITIETRGGNTFERVNREWTERSKLRIGVRQWLAARFDPKRFGEKQQVEHSGSIELKLGLRLDDALRYRDTILAEIDVTPQIEGDTVPEHEQIGADAAPGTGLMAREISEMPARAREQLIDVTPLDRADGSAAILSAETISAAPSTKPVR